MATVTYIQKGKVYQNVYYSAAQCSNWVGILRREGVRFLEIDYTRGCAFTHRQIGGNFAVIVIIVRNFMRRI